MGRPGQDQLSGTIEVDETYVSGREEGTRGIETMNKSIVVVAHSLMPRVPIVASLLKRWLIGTNQGGIQSRHLDYYLDEFTFRFNRRKSKARVALPHGEHGTKC